MSNFFSKLLGRKKSEKDNVSKDTESKGTNDMIDQNSIEIGGQKFTVVTLRDLIKGYGLKLGERWSNDNPHRVNDTFCDACSEKISFGCIFYYPSGHRASCEKCIDSSLKDWSQSLKLDYFGTGFINDAIEFNVLFSSQSNSFGSKKSTVEQESKIKDQLVNNSFVENGLMKENLNVERFRNGDLIPEVKDDSEWEKAGKKEQPAWSYYKNDAANGNTHGKLYNWYAVNDPRGLAPEGWHVPSMKEWEVLTDSLGKKIGPAICPSEEISGSDFSGLLSGWRGYDGEFCELGDLGCWWSSDDSFEHNKAFNCELEANGWITRRDYGHKNHCYKSSGFSVRCLKDSSEKPLEKIETIEDREQKIEELHSEKKIENPESDFIKIGSQIWKKENLNVERFRNGDLIPEVKDDSEWEKAGKKEQPAWSYYKNDAANGNTHGKLYNWYAVNDPRGLAPEGWHIPSDDEWTKLTDYLGGTEKAGGKLKSKSLWENPNTGATNESGFSGLPGGYRLNSGSFFYVGYAGCWWSSSELVAYATWSRNLFCFNGTVSSGNLSKSSGLSVRCLRDT